MRVYCHDGLSAERVIDALSGVPGLAKIWSAEAVARELDQPLDREGDVAVMGDERTVIGARAADHDLSDIKGHRLRTHGSLWEADVPFVLNRPLKEDHARRAESRKLDSYEIFDFALNGVA